MKAIMLDKNIDCDDLVETCNREQLVDCCHLYHDLEDADDTEVVRDAISRNRILVTNDIEIAEYVCKLDGEILSKWYPGIVVVALDDDSRETITIDHTTAILRAFKQEVSNWQAVACDNSVVTIQPHSVTVNHIERGLVKRTGFIARDSHGWQEKLHRLLSENGRLASPD